MLHHRQPTLVAQSVLRPEIGRQTLDCVIHPAVDQRSAGRQHCCRSREPGPWSPSSLPGRESHCPVYSACRMRDGLATSVGAHSRRCRSGRHSSACESRHRRRCTGETCRPRRRRSAAASDDAYDDDNERRQRGGQRSAPVSAPPLQQAHTHTHTTITGAVWCSGHVVRLTDKITVHHAWLILRWVTIFIRHTTLVYYPAT